MTVITRNGNKYQVRSSDSGKVYEVDLSIGSCSCPHHQYRSAHCKHLQAVEQEKPELKIETLDELNELLFG